MTRDKSSLTRNHDLTKQEMLRLVTKHRMAGNEIDENFAAILYEKHGIRNSDGGRYTVSSLKNHFTRYMRKAADDTRENFSGYQELQKMRLERLLSIAMNELDTDDSIRESYDDDESGRYALTHKSKIGYIQQCKSIIAELSTLTGANAPVELLVSSRIQTEITIMHDALKSHLPEDTFAQVAAVLEHIMGLSQQRLGEAQAQRTAQIKALEADVTELTDEDD